MGNATNGAKAGVIAGIVYGIILGVTSYFTVVADKSTILSAITRSLPANSPFTPEQLYGIVVLVTPAIVLVGGIIGGVIVGAVYGALFRRVPGKTPIVKGIVVGLVLWVILSLVGGLRDMQYGALYYGTQAAIGLVAILIFGVLLGYFYGRFSHPPQSDPAMQGL